MNEMRNSLRVYWRPGCSSCVKIKEFLTNLGVEYESINVSARPEAMEEIAGHTESTAVDADILAEQKHALVGLHRLCQCFADCFRVRQLPGRDLRRLDVSRHRHPG